MSSDLRLVVAQKRASQAEQTHLDTVRTFSSTVRVARNDQVPAAASLKDLRRSISTTPSAQIEQTAVLREGEGEYAQTKDTVIQVCAQRGATRRDTQPAGSELFC